MILTKLCGLLNVCSEESVWEQQMYRQTQTHTDRQAWASAHIKTHSRQKNPQKASEKSVTLFACVGMSQAGDEHI